MAEKLTKEQVVEIKRKRAAEKRLMVDRLRFWVGTFAVPSILIMVCIEIFAAIKLESDALAVITGLGSTVTLGMINLLNNMGVPPPPEDPLATVAKDLVHHLQDQSQKDMEVSIDRNKIKIGGNGVKLDSKTPADPVWGDDIPLTNKKGTKKK